MRKTINWICLIMIVLGIAFMAASGEGDNKTQEVKTMKAKENTHGQ